MFPVPANGGGFYPMNEAVAKRAFTCPLDCLPGIGDVWGGQYGIPSGVKIKGIPRVLDIGANCGAFTLYARAIWPGCYVKAYEPQPDIFEYLKANVHDLPNVTADNWAVGDTKMTYMRRGTNNRLCTSFYELGEQSDERFETTVIAPEELPEADIVKIDTEGAEDYIVQHLSFVPKILILEWHGDDKRYAVDLAMRGKMNLIASRVIGTCTGIYVFAACDL